MATVQIGGVDANVESASAAPEAVAGLFQINARIPQSLQAGSVPIVVRVGAASSQAGATVWVQ